MGFVTVFCPLTTTGAGELVVQTGDTRFVVDCKVNPAALAGHVKIMFVPEAPMVSCGGLVGANEILNTVPLSELPPTAAVPYRVLPDRISPPYGLAPSLLVPGLGPESGVKLCKVVKP